MDGCRDVTTRSVSTIVVEANAPSAPEQLKSDGENRQTRDPASAAVVDAD